MKKFFILITYCQIFTILCCSDIFAQSFQYVSPKPGSTYNTMESTIIIREGSFIDRFGLNEFDIFVYGSISGKINGELLLSNDNKTIIFKPYQKFLPGEKVTVEVKDGIKKSNGGKTEPYIFTFDIAPFTKTPNPYAEIAELCPDYGMEKHVRKSSTRKTKLDFPPMNIVINDSVALGEGYIFLAVASHVENIGYYLMMLNNDGTPFYSKELIGQYSYDFKMQPNGYLTYAQFIREHEYTGGGEVIHMIMDNSFNIVDSVQMGNGYIAEAHDFEWLPNGHYLLFGYYLVELDMSQYVTGGYPNALLAGTVVQELDADKNVVFQWRTWDNYDYAYWIEPYKNFPQLKRPIVPTFHMNNIKLDIDGNLIISSPQENLKVNRQTGEIMWELGGLRCEFQYIGLDYETGLEYTNGHYLHRLKNGNFLIYDNGTKSGTRTSQVHEFKLDEVNKTVEMVWSFIPDTLIAGNHRGNAQRLPNGNTVIGWGGSQGKYSPTFTEVDAAGNVLMEIFFDPYAIESYRAFRFPFTDGLPIADVIQSEIAGGNTFTFIDDNTGYTGVDVKVNSYTGTGYNELRVKKWEYAPKSPQFLGKAPIVLPRRAVLSQVGITGIDMDIRIDVDEWGLNDPENSIIYQREFEDAGLFIPLQTIYNFATRKLTANTTMFGEFIVCKADLGSMLFAPLPNHPENNSTVNHELPVTISWSPMGFANTFSLQVASDSEFTNLIVDQTEMMDAFHTLDDVLPESQYFWRVKTHNDAGDSPWCETQSFTTINPFITLTTPESGEQWHVGFEYFIKWDDNIDEDVVISLYKNDQYLRDIATAISDRAYLWEVNLDLQPGDDYKLQIASVNDETLFDISDAVFSIIDTVTSVDDEQTIPDEFVLEQNYPNPFNPETVISYHLPVVGITTLKVYDILGNVIATLVDEYKTAGYHQETFNAAALPSGVYIYTLKCGNYSETKKMVLLK
ncbi:MAG: hypothetical protein A2V66_02080 [Ignavibacteria bacterium RBG_13_36_8]|nr:MAG: hypothetical protein A2V66_02080 [Ignavibacteria bacterium RBG_13_36_8]